MKFIFSIAHNFLFSLFFVLTIYSQQYKVVQINSAIYPQKINNNDQVIGFGTGTTPVPVIWDNGNLINIPNVSYGYGRAINDSGVACGGEFIPANYNFNIFIYRNGSTTIIPPIAPSKEIEAFGINKKGWLTGFMQYLSTPDSRAFIYNGTSIFDLGVPSGYIASWGNAINDSGYVAGNVYNNSGHDFPSIYKKSMEPLNVPVDATGGNATDINDQNIVCGNVSIPSGSKAVIWDATGNYVELPRFDGDYAMAESINDSNVAVGQVLNSSAGISVGVLWKNGQIYNLNDLIDSTLNINLTDAISINDSGDVLCEDEYGHGYILLNPRKRYIINPKGVIIKPVADEVVPVNNEYEIKWENVNYLSLTVKFSSDGGMTFSNIATGIPGSADSISWITPDSIKSNCRIFLVDDRDSSEYVESGRFALANQVTPVKEYNRNPVPSQFRLEQNYPNPFNPSTMISYALPKSAKVKIVVFNMLGENVATLTNRFEEPGNYKVKWNAEGFSSGVYFYRLTAGNYTEIKKMLLLK